MTIPIEYQNFYFIQDDKGYITEKGLSDLINNRLTYFQIRLDIARKLSEVLSRFIGKKITNRLVTEIKKVLPNYTVEHSKCYEFHIITIFDNDIPRYDGYSFPLAPHKENIITNESINQLREDFIEQLVENLKNADIESIVDLWNKSRDDTKLKNIGVYL